MAQFLLAPKELRIVNNKFNFDFEKLPIIFTRKDISVPDGENEKWKDRFLANVRERNLAKAKFMDGVIKFEKIIF